MRPVNRYKTEHVSLRQIKVRAGPIFIINNRNESNRVYFIENLNFSGIRVSIKYLIDYIHFLTVRSRLYSSCVKEIKLATKCYDEKSHMI